MRVRRGGEGLIGTLLSIIIHCPVLFQVPRGARKFGWGRAYNQNILFISRQIGHISLTGLIISGRGDGENWPGRCWSNAFNTLPNYHFSKKILNFFSL